MKVLRSLAELVAWRASLHSAERVAFVPTMGYLHRGHESLLEAARERCPTGTGQLLLSIFVNPTQFDEDADLASYPRDETRDLAIAAGKGVDCVFAPEDQRELYPEGPRAWVEIPEMAQNLCGAGRQGHFRGVCTIVAKLWSLVRADYSYFGDKDFQQLAILRRLHAELFFPGEVIGMPIVREPDGLALSSRNVRLTPEQRTQALCLSRFLEVVRARFAAGARRKAQLLEDELTGILAPVELEYVELVDALSLERVEEVLRPTQLALAARVGEVRLIDNLRLCP